MKRWANSILTIRYLSYCLLTVGLLPSVTAAEEQATICRYCEHAHQAAPSSHGSIHYAPDRVVDVTHIKLDVTPNFEEESVEVIARLSFKPLMKPLEELRLDGVELDVQQVTSSSRVRDFSTSAEAVTILFEEPITSGTDSWVEITYSARPTRGLYFRTPKMGYPETDTHLWTQGEPHEARHWFPCFDYPNERSSTEIICHVPQEMTVLSNGKRLSESVEGDIKTVHWKQEKPHANYLICLVAGHFEKLEKSHRDVPLAFFSQPSIAAHAKNSFRDTPEIMNFFEEEIGVPFPWDKYYQVTIRDFMWGGMENTSLTTLTHSTVFAEETENIHSSRGLDAHEMAHQWFGDYVTCKDWSHLWLNEGFATFYTHLFKGYKAGEEEMLYGLYRDAEGRILTQGKDKRPIVYKGYESAGEQFDYRAYPKGSWVLHMLRSQLGPELYRQCIQAYLERHALSPVVTADLVRVIEEQTGQSFDRFFDQWVFRPRFPDLQVNYSWNPKKQLARVTVKQTHETDDDVRLFEFPTKLRFYVNGEIVDHEVEINEQQHDFYIALADEPAVFRFDPDYSVLAKVNVNVGGRRGKSLKMLAAQLKNDDDVMGRLLAVKELATQSGRQKKAQAVELLAQTLAQDPFWGVRVRAAKALQKIATDESFTALSSHVDQQDARVRDEVVFALGKSYRPETLDQLKQLYQSESNPEIRSTVVRALGKFDAKETQAIVKQALATKSFKNEEAAAAIRAVRTQNNLRLRKHLQAMLTSRGNELGSRTLGEGLNTLAQLSRPTKKKRETRDFIEGYLDHPKATVRLAAVRALGELGDPSAEGLLESLSSDRDDRLAKVAATAIKKLRDETPFVPGEVAELRKIIDELKGEYDALRDELEQLKLSSAARQQAPENPESEADEAAESSSSDDSDDATESDGTNEQGEKELARDKAKRRSKRRKREAAPTSDTPRNAADEV
jgi:aminopeptidase N